MAIREKDLLIYVWGYLPECAPPPECASMAQCDLSSPLLTRVLNRGANQGYEPGKLNRSVKNPEPGLRAPPFWPPWAAN